MSCRKDLAGQLAAAHERLGGARGKQYWRSLDELAETPAFMALVHNEFPSQASIWPDTLSRRKFLSLMAASLALGGIGGCSVKPAPTVNIVPYVKPPREIEPGEPLFFATSLTHAGSAVGVLVESHMGRPTKIEGNPDHPASRGATDVFGQAAILSLYDPDRSQTVAHLGQTRTWEDAEAALREALARQRDKRGRGLRILSETVVSPTLAAQRDELLAAFPDAHWHVYEPVNRDSMYTASDWAFGRQVDTHYDFTQADVVLALDADFMMSLPGHLRYVDDFLSRRRLRQHGGNAAKATMNRLYAVEPGVSCTGAKADHRLALRAGQIESFARAVATACGIESGGSVIGGSAAGNEKWLEAVAADLQAHRGRSLVLAGDRQPPAVHLLAHAINDRLGNVGKTVHYTDAWDAGRTERTASLKELAEALDRGDVELLVILGGNPVYNAPVDLALTEKMQKVPLRVHFGPYDDETARQCHWHLPEAHFLEAWSDARAYDGTQSIVQPLIEPLYQGRSAHELLTLLAGAEPTPGYETVRRRWRREATTEQAADFEAFWESVLHDGLLADSAQPRRSVTLADNWQRHLGAGKTTAEPAATELELVFEPDPTIYDGSYANNGWLQECPKPLTKLTWDNAAIMSPSTAEQLGLAHGGYAHGGEHGGYHMPVVELRLNSRSVRAPVWIMPGHAERSITVHLGHGRQQAGRVGGADGHTVGFNAYLLRTSEQPWFAPGLELVPTGETYLLAGTQQHHLMENRELVRSATLGEFRDHPDFAAEPERKQREEQTQRGSLAIATLYEGFNYEAPKHKWGMAIDLSACIGCNACVVACQAENNIPVVGKEQVAAGREMHWIRIDRYSTGTAEKPEEFYFQPVPCMHCENAPCEYVCPVEATVHSSEGLNDMVYNRCVGTRFCSNNCPYKVRRFNFFHYADYHTPTLRLQYNPDVTVRSRGVMEKCSYCVQRIRHASINADTEGRPIADGEILTACQAACPATAISFGDINDKASQVHAWKGQPLNYSLLADVNTLPRTTYLAAVRNPNGKLSEE
ncbi:MAG TPA: TAT-variant-translocated molybdopterin oxidoreductase [Pirellulales bacterium]|jgi:molybdopterin-containing oxidoreductase family iron-sulfur binding subunit|nr:TAT-variant-translocated molybdopterin oxidoreductase [Pirellulales bacterium]